MDARKLEFAQGVRREVDELCQLIFNTQSAENMINILGVSNDQINTLITQMVLALYHDDFLRMSPKLIKELAHLCAQEFIFFQVQEGKNDPSYAENLKRFIASLSRDISLRIENDNQLLGMKEHKNDKT